ncbi:ABC transporter permease [Staphylococcus devriesei]|uniref:Putative hemin transport system permease protein HrtB n=1 Tax=Staphylococcus devriesei TaxID=586733 RepID=A0A2K4DT95_9STAP|nr:ABC transporter permease [Staphylococcus devriesei]MCE5090121.1 ABC transporter permease [Staphylococcus devriesei]MCE5096860.1 ABC transporter permease [Staphylococcus devriesei]PNZ90028.1 heme ABC transporter permease [Staphylococcus devriesei]PTE73430.1 ABC transporter permease [Staphylococcus devriesei]PTF03287.1 ABC transporter permease [Staphylococcus devriesei]
MNLAWKEMKFYKFRYILIMLIIFLLGIMVLFISGLAQGLARENVSFLSNMPAQKYVMQDTKEPKLESSQLSDKQQSKIEGHVKQQPTKIGAQTIKIKNQEEDITTLSTPKKLYPSLKSGSYPTKDNQIAINNKLTSEDIKEGDYVTFKGHNERYQVSGIIDDSMYSHSSMVLMSSKGFNNMNKKASTFYPVKQLSDKDEQKLNSIDGVKVVNEETLTNNIPSYQAEQMPLNLMIISLFVITAIVLSAFFYVMTIQKIPQIGILKAIGIKTKHLLLSLILQIIFTTMIGVIIALAIILLLNLVMPVSMPFYLSNSNVILMVVMFLVVGFIGVLLSFIKVVKVDPIEAIGGGE